MLQIVASITIVIYNCKIFVVQAPESVKMGALFECLIQNDDLPPLFSARVNLIKLFLFVTLNTEKLARVFVFGETFW
jgi:hypothetical protein